MSNIGFSSALKLTDLNDFIQPSQACIKPAETIKENTKQEQDGDVIRINKSKNKSWKNRDNKKQSQNNEESGKKLGPVSVTLGDCLACSGCITSAEAVLIAEQSHEKVMNVLAEKQQNNLIVAMTLSLQALASLAAKYRLDSIQSTAERISHLFHSLGVDYVFDITLARHICLNETWKEFLQHHNQSKQGAKQQPLLSSTCPGFVCYAEKSQGDILVPHLSRIKSPQQIMGILIKRRLHLVDEKFNDNINPDRIYHIALMPCYDKKLEASRLENRLNESTIPEVDCVITPLEVEKILESQQIDNLYSQPSRPIDRFNSIDFNREQQHWKCIHSHYGSGSGGYAENMIRMMAAYQRQIAKEKFLKNPNEIEWSIGRNSDFLEFKLQTTKFTNKVTESETELSFAILNGFRNIQNLVTRLKRRKCEYDYIEISACPKGCLNGGAQFRNLNFNDQLNEKFDQDSDPVMITFEQVEKLYQQLPKINLPDENIDQLYQQLQLDNDLRENFRTKFKILEKKFNILNSNW